MTKQKETTLNISLPQAWLVKFEVLAQQTGRSCPELMQEALGQYLEGMPAPPILEQMQHLETSLETLQQKVAAFEPFKQQVGKCLLRLESIESKLTDTTKMASSSQITFTSQSEAIDDDDDDEPDEVLTDFLPR